MTISIDPEARRRFSEQARNLLPLLQRRSVVEEGEPPRGSRAHAHVPVHLTMEDFVGHRLIQTLEEPFTDHLVDVVIETPAGDYRLDRAGAEKVQALAEKVANHEALRRLCGRDYVQTRLIEWLHDSQGDDDARPWMEILLERLQRDVIKRAILIPIDGMVIEEAFPLGRIVFDFFTAEYFARSLAYIREHGVLSDDDLAKVARNFEGYRGVVYARFECEAESEWAKERAFEETEAAVSCLRFFHPAAMEARALCSLGRLGGQSPHLLHFFDERQGVVMASGGEARRWGHDFDPTRPAFRVRASKGFARVDELLRATERTEMEDRVLQAMILYSGGLLFEAVEQRLLHALVALESLLLRNENEPILYSLTQRAAHMIGKTLVQRREIVRVLKDAYRLRSAFVHHGKRVPADRIDVLNLALRWIWTIVCTLLTEPRIRNKELRTKEQMLGEIDEIILT